MSTSTPLTANALPSSLKSNLILQGFEFTPADVWGKVLGEGTAFLEVHAEYTLAWVYLVEQEAFLGERLRIEGAPDKAVPEALRQLHLVLCAHEMSAAVEPLQESVWDTTRV